MFCLHIQQCHAVMPSNQSGNICIAHSRARVLIEACKPHTLCEVMCDRTLCFIIISKMIWSFRRSKTIMFRIIHNRTHAFRIVFLLCFEMLTIGFVMFVNVQKWLGFCFFECGECSEHRKCEFYIGFWNSFQLVHAIEMIFLKQQLEPILFRIKNEFRPLVVHWFFF